MRILLADHTILFRLGMAAILARSLDVSDVDQTADAKSAIAAAEAYPPDVCLLAADLPGGAITVAERIRASHPEVRMVVLVNGPEEIPWLEHLQLPADRYLPRTATPGELVRSLQGRAPMPAWPQAAASEK